MDIPSDQWLHYAAPDRLLTKIILGNVSWGFYSFLPKLTLLFHWCSSAFKNNSTQHLSRFAGLWWLASLLSRTKTFVTSVPFPLAWLGMDLEETIESLDAFWQGCVDLEMLYFEWVAVVLR